MEKSLLMYAVKRNYVRRKKKEVHTKYLQMKRKNDSDLQKLNERFSEIDFHHPFQFDHDILCWPEIQKDIQQLSKAYNEDLCLNTIRTVTEYHKMYEHLMIVNYEKFTATEMEKLNEIANKFGGHDWKAIHREYHIWYANEFININHDSNRNLYFDERNVDSNEIFLRLSKYRQRSLLLLFQNYQRYLNKYHIRGPWIPMDDEQMWKISRIFGENDNMSLSFFMDRRIPRQCRQRLGYLMMDNSAFTINEDFTLFLLLCSLNSKSKRKTKNLTYYELFHVKQLFSGTENNGYEWWSPQKLIFKENKKEIERLGFRDWITLRQFIGNKDKLKERFIKVFMDTVSFEKLDFGQIIFLSQVLINGEYRFGEWQSISEAMANYNYDYYLHLYEKYKKRMPKNKKNVRMKKKILQILDDGYVRKPMTYSALLVIANTVVNIFGVDGKRLLFFGNESNFIGFMNALRDWCMYHQRISASLKYQLSCENNKLNKKRQQTILVLKGKLKKVEMKISQMQKHFEMCTNHEFSFSSIKDILITRYLNEERDFAILLCEENRRICRSKNVSIFDPLQDIHYNLYSLSGSGSDSSDFLN